MIFNEVTKPKKETFQFSNKNGFLKIHSVESFGTFDGPGIRFVVFLQGCPFQCLYCANPDTMEFNSGKERSIEELLKEAIHMKSYFANSGGVTVSGGEPCCQAKDLIHLFKELKKEGIHTALDTNGFVLNKYVKQLLDLTDLVLLDVKHIDNTIHKIVTSRSNDKTLAFADYLRKINKPTWLRYVLVPELTDQPEYLEQFGTHFQNYENIEKLEIQPYHKLGVHKWKLLGKQYPLEGFEENTLEQLKAAKKMFEKYFRAVVIN